MLNSSKNIYSYFLNGLYITSEIEFPELLLCPQNCGISIKLGTVPRSLQNVFYTTFDEQIAADEYLLDIAEVAKYYINKSGEVIIEPYTSATEEDIRVYFLSSVLSVLLFKHNYFPLHASSIKIRDKAALIVGHSGRGKSTLAFGLLQKGYLLLNDDISTIYTDEQGTVSVFPGVSHLKLSSKSLESFNQNVSGLQKIANWIDKFSFPVQRFPKNSSTPVKALLFIDFAATNEFEHTQIGGIELFSLLTAHTFNKYLIKQLQKSTVHFKLSTELMKQVPCFKVVRPMDTDPKLYVDYIEKLIENI